MKFDREKRNAFSEWWWTVDRAVLFLILAMLGFGCLMVGSAGPAVAGRFTDQSFYFVIRQLAFIAIGAPLMIGLSFFSERWVRRFCLAGFVGAVGLVLGVLAFAPAINGAKRWISMGGMTLQPSEVLKPFFIVTTAWLLSRAKNEPGFPGYLLAVLACVMVVGLLLMQPDFGMTMVVVSVWAGQIFLSGVPLMWVGVLAAAGLAVAGLAYASLEHVRERVASFLGETNYQAEKSLQAFHSGGWFGRGPGEGVVKPTLPDAHTDFIYAVVSEEFGAVFAVGLAVCYGLIVTLSARRLLHQERNLFVLLAACGLLMQFGLQAMVNMCVAVHMMPTKGMTLPLISYGGSSMLGICIGLGVVLRLTRRRFGRWPERPYGLAAY